MTTLLITSFLLLLLCSLVSASGNVYNDLGEVTNESFDLDQSYSYSESSKDNQEGSLWLCKSTCPDDPARAKQKCTKACEKKYGRPTLTPKQQCMAECRAVSTSKDEKKVCKKDCRLKHKYKQKACLTPDECEDASRKMGIDLFYEGKFHTKGCFMKETKHGLAAFFSNGSVGDMSTANLSGKKKRLWCAKADEA